MDLYIFPEFEAVLRASALLIAFGLLGFLLARWHRWGAVAVILVIAAACWQLLLPLVPPSTVPPGYRADLWRQIVPALMSALAAGVLTIVGVRTRRSRPAA